MATDFLEPVANNVPAPTSDAFYPGAVSIDKNGNFYVTDDRDIIRKIDSHHIITTAAGNGTDGFSGDGGQATSAQLGSPSGTLIGNDGNLLYRRFAVPIGSEK